MDDGSTGALVPAAVTSEGKLSPGLIAREAGSATTSSGGKENEIGGGGAEELDKELLCPICMQIIKDAFLTACGHSFCYICIVTHLNNKNDCPCCGNYLSTTQLFPNFLLDKLLKKTSASVVSKTASPVEPFCQALQKGCEVSVKELDTLLLVLAEKKRKLEQEEAERNMQILFDFLHCVRKQEVDELNQVYANLQYIKEDVNAVERHRIDLCRVRDRFSVRMRMLSGDSAAPKSSSLSMDKNSMGLVFNARNRHGEMTAGNFQYKKADSRPQENSTGSQRKETSSGLSSQHMSQSGLAVLRKKRVQLQFNDLQECYLQKRRQLDKLNQSHSQEETNKNGTGREGYCAGLSDFQSVLTTFTQYSRLRVIAELRHGDLFHSANIVSSIEFDRDDELFATAGVSRRIKVFDFSTVVNEPAEVHCPVVEMSTRSKLSCLSWNKYAKNHIASSDYEGIVTVWDVNTRQMCLFHKIGNLLSVMEYEEHEKRAWSVDFSHKEPSMLVSGSDDCKVKVWSTKQENSVLNIDMKANICCVKYNPGSSIHVAVGSADHHIHYYDLRNTSRPLHVFSGHRKTVSYVKFLSSYELASASTDSTLRLWDVKENMPVRTFRGHTNEKNFVGLSVNKDFIACGSESNEVFAYHKCEVQFLGKYSHPNLVRLLGCCFEDVERLLVYEYMPKGSLDSHLFRKGAKSSLPWARRIKIAVGAARGLSFLHTTEKQVIYRDFKSSNILLDRDYNAKLSDFGLAKLGPTNGKSHITTCAMGTLGYVAPEYIATGHLYVKSDVYGFGVMLVELMTGLQVLDTSRPKGQNDLVSWARPFLTDKRKLEKIMDPQLGQEHPLDGALKLAALAIYCLESDPNFRPSMERVLESLDGISAIKMTGKGIQVIGQRHFVTRQQRQEQLRSSLHNL